METAWDWITVFVFAGLATLLLQRSVEDSLRDELWQYLPPAAGCALANYLGNEGLDVLAAFVLIFVGFYIWRVLKVKFPKV